MEKKKKKKKNQGKICLFIWLIFWKTAKVIITFIILTLISGVQYDKTSAGWQALARVACLCSKAEFKGGQDNIAILKRWVAETKLVI